MIIPESPQAPLESKPTKSLDGSWEKPSSSGADADGVPVTAVTGAEKYCTAQDSALLYAWQLKSGHSLMSSIQKKSYINQWMAAILLNWFVVFLGVATVLPGLAQLFDADPTGTARNIVRLMLIFSAFTLTGVLNSRKRASSDFTWIVYWDAAENIRRQIYLYRVSAGDYSKPGLTPVQKQHLLIDNVTKIRDNATKQLSELNSENTEDSDQAVPVSPIYPLLRDVLNEEQPEVIRMKLGIRTDHWDDDGFSAITSGNDYLEWRVIPQRDWYVSLPRHDYYRVRRNRMIMLAMAGLGSLFAVLGGSWEHFVIVAASGSTAVNNYIQMQLFGRPYTNYRVTGERLSYHIALWNILAPEQQKDPVRVASFVEKVEEVFHLEKQISRDSAIRMQTEKVQSFTHDVKEKSE